MPTPFEDPEIQAQLQGVELTWDAHKKRRKPKLPQLGVFPIFVFAITTGVFIFYFFFKGATSSARNRTPEMASQVERQPIDTTRSLPSHGTWPTTESAEPATTTSNEPESLARAETQPSLPTPTPIERPSPLIREPLPQQPESQSPANSFPVIVATRIPPSQSQPASAAPDSFPPVQEAAPTRETPPAPVAVVRPRVIGSPTETTAPTPPVQEAPAPEPWQNRRETVRPTPAPLPKQRVAADTTFRKVSESARGGAVYLATQQVPRSSFQSYARSRNRAVAPGQWANVTYADAEHFTRWLTQVHRANQKIRFDEHYRLPTRSEERSNSLWQVGGSNYGNERRGIKLVLVREEREIQL